MGQVLGQILVSIQELPSAAEWGWHLSLEKWKPTWTTLPEASNTCNELIGDFASAPRQTCHGNSYQDFLKKLSSKILPLKTFNCLAFTARKKLRPKNSGIDSSSSSLLTFSLFLTLGVLCFPKKNTWELFVLQ